MLTIAPVRPERPVMYLVILVKSIKSSYIKIQKIPRRYDRII